MGNHKDFSARINVKLSPDLKHELRMEAARRNMSGVSELVRDLLMEQVNPSANRKQKQTA